MIERNRAAADVAEALGQPGSFRTLSAIDSDSHPATEQEHTVTASIPSPSYPARGIATRAHE